MLKGQKKTDFVARQLVGGCGILYLETLTKDYAVNRRKG